MRVAVLGGSFNPPHICHVFISCYVLTTFDIDQVWFVPCYKHAFGKELLSFHHRFTMCCLAVESLRKDLVKVSSIEKERHGTSWTIDTVRYLKADYPGHDFTWIIGSDVLDEMDKWKDFEQIQQLVSFIVIPRAGFLHKSHDHLYYSDNLNFQLPNVSSTLVRERVKQKKPITHLVPGKIEDYIRTHRLYEE